MSQQHLLDPAAPQAAAASARNRFGAVLAAAAALTLGAIAFGPASPALAHDQLVGSEVVEKADGTAEAVRLSFSNSIIEVGTEFVLTGPDGADAKGGDPVVDGPDVTQPIAPALEAGDYAGAWRVVSSDGHPIDGVFTLSVAADGSAELREGVIAGTDEHTDEEEVNTADANQDATTSNDAGGAPVGAILGFAGGAIVIVAIAVMLVARRRSGAFPDSHTSTDTPDSTEGSL